MQPETRSSAVLLARQTNSLTDAQSDRSQGAAAVTKVQKLSLQGPLRSDRHASRDRTACGRRCLGTLTNGACGFQGTGLRIYLYSPSSHCCLFSFTLQHQHNKYSRQQLSITNNDQEHHRLRTTSEFTNLALNPITLLFGVTQAELFRHNNSI